MTRRLSYKIYILSFITLFCFKNSLFSAYGIGRNDYLPDKGTARLLGKVEASKSLAAEMTRLSGERAALIIANPCLAQILNDPDHNKRIQAILSGGSSAERDLLLVIQNLDEQIRGIGIYKSSLFRPNNSGTLVARGLAGRDWEFLDDSKIDDMGEGIVQGMMVRTSKALGDVLSERISGAFETTLGGTFDYLFSKLIDVWDYACGALFHDFKEPFTIENLKAWQESIKDSFEDIEKMMKDGLKDSLRGHDMTLRQFEIAEPQKNEEKVDDAKGVFSTTDQDMFGLKKDCVELSLEDRIPKTPWADFVESYVEHFERCINEIDKRKGYYDHDSDEVFFAEQLKKRLMKFGTVLLQSQSIKDLDAAIESNKALIPAIRKRIDNIFKRLIESIKPRTYSLADKSGSNVGRDTIIRKDRSVRREAEDEDREFPNSYWSR